MEGREEDLITLRSGRLVQSAARVPARTFPANMSIAVCNAGAIKDITFCQKRQKIRTLRSARVT